MTIRAHRRGLGASIVGCLTGLALLLSGTAAWAANGAYAVDDADVAAPGSCKIESFLAFASNRDFIAAATPSCAIDLGRTFEFSGQFQRFRADGEWGTSLQLKAKTNILPVQTGKIGMGAAGGASFDLVTGDNTGFFAYVPVTVAITDEFRLLINGGWLWDRVAARHYLTYGAGFEWEFVKQWTLIAEVFGQVGAALQDNPTVTKPRAQVGLRYTPIEAFDVDVIYGRNITGENANWITVGLNVRFPPPKK
jgi:hypothetical protein